MNIYTYVIAGMSGSFLLCVGLFLFYLKYKKNLLVQQNKLQIAELEHQKALLNSVIASQEQERKRIGMDLHDEVGSTLSSLRLMIENFTDASVNSLPVKDFNEQSKTVIDAIIANVRNISHDLSPLLNGDHGFVDAVMDFCDGINKHGHLAIAISFMNGAEDVKLPDPAKLGFYRVIVELINNTIKHAGATEVSLLFALNGNSYTIEYGDNGTGIPADKIDQNKGMGFKNIESRLHLLGAVYTINPGNTPGFRIHIQYPLANQ